MPQFRIVALLAAGACCAWGLDPNVSLSQYARRHWQVEDGLPQNYVTWLTQSPEGYLLVGTAGGAARFDGIRFTPVVLDRSTGRTREWVTSVQPGSQPGQLWVATRDSGFYQIGGRHWNTRFDSLAVDRSGEPVGLGAGLYRRTNGELRRVREGLTPADPSWGGLLELRDGSGFLAVTAQGLFRFAGPGLTSPPVSLMRPDAPEGKPLSVAHSRKSGGVWIGTTEGLYHSRTIDPRPLSLHAIAGVHGPVVSIVEDKDGVVWAGTWGFGLWRVVGGKAESFTARDGLDDNFVHAVFEDRDGNLWIGTRAGLSRWKSTPILPYGLPEGANGQFFSTVSGDASGSVWLGTWRSGLYQVRNGGNPEHVPLPRSDLTMLVRATATSPRGDLWLSDWMGLYYRRGSRWMPVTSEHLGYPAAVHALLFDRAGNLWVGTDSGLYLHGSTEPLTKGVARIPNRSVRSLAQDSKGRIWAGSLDGLWRIDSADAAPVAIQGLANPAVTSVSEDTQGRIWATTRADGLVLVSDSGIRVFDARHGLPALPVYAVVDDGRGALWLSSPAGIYSVPVTLLDDLVGGRRASIPVLAYGQDDGMRTIECQNVGWPSAWKDSAGDLWFPTVRGAIRVRPWKRQIPGAPTVLVESVETERQSHTVRFTAARLGAPSHVEFRYRLAERQQDWIAIGSERTLRFDALSAGSHQLLISARDQGGEWGEAVQLTLTQAARWYETWWFRLGIVGLAAGALFALYRWRVYSIRGRYAAVLSERTRIAGEWHDTLLAGFSAISWQLDVAMQKIGEKPEAAARTLEVARTMLQHYRAEARRVIWDLRQDSPDAVSLASALETALKRMTDERGISFHFEVTGNAREVSGEVAQNLLRICQEATANAIHHGAPTRVDVTLLYAADCIALTVRDDGTGFDPGAVAPGHFGLQIMQERARRFGGDVDVSSDAGNGTTVIANIPVPASKGTASSS